MSGNFGRLLHLAIVFFVTNQQLKVAFCGKNREKNLLFRALDELDWVLPAVATVECRDRYRAMPR